MWYVATLFYCSLFVSLSESAPIDQYGGSILKDGGESTNLVGFVGIGYDLLEGNPEGDFDRGGLDPGFKLAQNIFKVTYDEGKEVTFEGSVIALPDQMEYQATYSCSSVEDSYTFSGTESYQEKLDVNVDASG